MTIYLSRLKQRNPLLFWFGIFNFIAAFVCTYFWITSSVTVNNINAFIKPLKFFISIGIFVWTMGWLLYYLNEPRKMKTYSIMVVIVMLFETFVITWQAANGRLSHFNITSTFYSILFSLMGVAITVLTGWTAYFGYLFFKRKDIQLSKTYLWGIRLGILCFVFFAFEGGIMAAQMKHTVGALDGGRGLPLVNWSREHGDLRIAHFLGMHTLQIFPLFGYYIARSPKTMIAFASIYFILISTILIRSLYGLPLF